MTPDKSAELTYDERVEKAIAERDVDCLIRYAYGYPCRCTTLKGEPMCVCKMFAAALRRRVEPRLLFQNRIERVQT